MKLIIGFSRSTKWFRPFSVAIIAWDKIRYCSDIEISHMYGRFTSTSWDRDFIYQASGHSTNFTGIKRFESLNKVVEEYEIEISEEAVVRIGQTCVDREGKPYAVKQTLGIVLVGIVWFFTGERIPNPLAHGDDATNCIEEWCKILSEDLGVEAPKDIESMSVKPVRDWVASLPMAKMIVR